MTTCYRSAAVALTLAVVATGCTSGHPGAKAGTTATVTLHFATSDSAVNPNGDLVALDEFVSAVSTLSGRRMSVTVAMRVGSDTPGSEAALIKAIHDGKYDGGWPATRAFATAGYPAFSAVEAPFLIQSYPAEQRFVTSPLAVQMMHRLDGTGLVAVGLIAGPLRRPFSVSRPLRRASDWQGVRFGVTDSAIQQSTARALGAMPVVRAGNLESQLKTGALGGMEYDMAQYDENGLGGAAHYVIDNAVLWPKIPVLTMNAHRYASLSVQQRSWLDEAAGRAVKTSAGESFDESDDVQRLCFAGVRFASLTATELAALRSAVQPVYESLKGNPMVAGDLAVLQAMSAAAPASPLTVPSGCRGTAPASASVDGTINTLPNIPDGVYRVRVTAQDIEAYGAAAHHASGNAGVVTMLRRGTYVVRVAFENGPGTFVVAEAGRIRGTADTVNFLPDSRMLSALGGCADCDPVTWPYSVGYTYAHSRLTVTVGAGMEDPVVLGVLTSHPWQRIG